MPQVASKFQREGRQAAPDGLSERRGARLDVALLEGSRASAERDEGSEEQSTREKGTRRQGFVPPFVSPPDIRHHREPHYLRREKN
jgi:hypothetical protein